MAGIYVHIPFCKKACTYCDFHFSTSMRNADEMVEAICKELLFKKERLKNQSIGSIYFGGGTPSVLSAKALSRIFTTIYQHYDVSSSAEITLEANPDDLNKANLMALKSLSLNRFSIGVQSFFEEDLLWMNRAHTASEAIDSIKRSQDFGYENLSIDLIYGYPLLSDEKWDSNIQTLIELQTPHISAYSLTVEPNTALSHAIKVGKHKPINDDQSAAQFSHLNRRLTTQGFEQYEISNYALPDKYAVHNTNYWRGVPYLGIGPSAHGFDGENRYHNLANNALYLKELAQNKLPETIEILSLSDQINELIMTSLRTQWGLDLKMIETRFGKTLAQKISKEAEVFQKKQQLKRLDDLITLTPEGKLFADGIASSLFVDEEELN